ncbi:uncharacterized protein METZ01_LOCUS342718, partial [marine metagenome]
MNMLLKQKLKTIQDDQREIEYNSELTSEKIDLKKKYIEDVKNNKDTILKEKSLLMENNEEEIFKKKSTITMLTGSNELLLKEISGTDKVNKDYSKLKDIKSTLIEKKSSNSKRLHFFEENDVCPTCEQELSNSSEMIPKTKKEVERFSAALVELEVALKQSEGKQSEIKDFADKIRDNEVKIATENSSMVQLEKFNATLLAEIAQLEDGEVAQSDLVELNKLDKHLVSLKKQRTKLKEDQTYAEASRNMLQDTGIKTKIIKQYLPIMNKLVNIYLTEMEFYVNFTLNENFEETIKSRYRDEFTYSSFSEGEKMRIDLALLFTWRAVA